MLSSANIAVTAISAAMPFSAAVFCFWFMRFSSILRFMDAAFFRNNRQQLLGKLGPGGFVALAGFGNMQRDVDEPFKFQQEGNFWYLTGIDEPDWRLFLD